MCLTYHILFGLELFYLGSICFFDFLLKTICFQNLGYLFFYFFISYYKLFTK